MNFGVSFVLALAVALRARQVQRSDQFKLVRIGRGHVPAFTAAVRVSAELRRGAPGARSGLGSPAAGFDAPAVGLGAPAAAALTGISAGAARRLSVRSAACDFALASALNAAIHPLNCLARLSASSSRSTMASAASESRPCSARTCSRSRMISFVSSISSAW